MEKKRILVGAGALTWFAEERRSDRYGSVWLSKENSLSEVINKNSYLNVLKSVKGKGRLIAKVTGTRKSTHIGDLHHKVYPSTPEVGEEIVLGSGTVFYENKYDIDAIGLKPDDNRNELWLDIKQLYRAHEQDVELYFEPL